MSMMRLAINTYLIVILLFITSHYAFAQEEVGKTVSVIGRVMVTHEGESRERPAVVPNPVFLHDTVTSDVGSRAKFMMKDDSILKIGPSSQLELNELVVGKEGQQTTIKQIKGHLRILLGKKLKPKSSFEVHTPVAVAGVRGTDFEVWVRNEGQTIVRCFEGEVEVSNILESVVGEVSLLANHYTIVEEGKPPVDAIPIPPGTPLSSLFAAKKEEKETEEEEQEQEEEQAEAEEAEPEGQSEVVGDVNDGAGADGGGSRKEGSAGGQATGGATTASSKTISALSTGNSADEAGAATSNESASGNTTGTGRVVTTSTAIQSTVSAVEGISPAATVDPLDTTEVTSITSPDWSETSRTGENVLKSLGLSQSAAANSSAEEKVNAATTNVNITSGISTDVIANSVLDDLINQTLDNTVEATVTEPIINSGTVSVEVTFPGP